MATEITKQGDAALPAFLQDFKGHNIADDIDNDDVTIPRVKLAQATSEEFKNGDVKIGSLFLNVTGEVLCEPGEKLRFIPVAYGKEYILWHPKRGEGILARARRTKHAGETRYEWDKQGEAFEVTIPKGPKVTWETKRFVDENGMNRWGSQVPGDSSSGIAATEYQNYIVVLPDHGNMVVALSLYRTQIKKAKDLNAMFKMNTLPVCGRYFSVETVKETKGDDDFYNYKFSPAGHLEDPNLFQYTLGLQDSFERSGYTVDQSDEDRGDSNEEKAF